MSAKEAVKSNDRKSKIDEKSLKRKSSAKSLQFRRTTNRARSQYTIHGRLDLSTSDVRQLYLPTYRLESQRPFNLDHMNFIVMNTVKWAINEPHMMTEFDSESAMKCCETISNQIKFRIKLHQYDRYRIIVIVNIYENQSQGIFWKMGFLWDTESDQWVSYQYDSKTFTVTVTLMVVYWE